MCLPARIQAEMAAAVINNSDGQGTGKPMCERGNSNVPRTVRAAALLVFFILFLCLEFFELLLQVATGLCKIGGSVGVVFLAVFDSLADGFADLVKESGFECLCNEIVGRAVRFGRQHIHYLVALGHTYPLITERPVV